MERALRVAATELDGLTAYVGEIADLVGQRDLTVEVEVAELPAGVRALCECATGRRFARVSVCADFFELAAEEQREAIVHEMIHPHLHTLTEHVQGLRSELGRAHYETVEANFTRDLERATDALTGALAGHLPLPTWRSSPQRPSG